MSTIKSKINWTDSAYRRAIKELRHFYSGYLGKDGFDLRSSDLTKTLNKNQRRKVREQFYYIDHIQSGIPKRIYRARTKSHIDIILGAQGYKGIPKNLKVAFVPDIADTKTTIKYAKPRKVKAYDRKKKKKVVLIELAPVESITNGVTRRYINISQEFMRESLKDAITEAMRLAKADRYAIQAGFHEVLNPEYKISANATDEDIEDKIKRLQLKYSQEDEQGKKLNNHWTNWLGGIIAYYYPDQVLYEDYIVKRSLARKDNKQKRKQERRIFIRQQKKEEKIKQKKVTQEKVDTAVKRAIMRERKKARKQVSVLKKQIRRLKK